MRTVLANGCFDPLHHGHVLHLRAARQLGDYLAVALTDDDAVRAEKGPGRPAVDVWGRIASLVELRCVDGVFVCDDVMTALQKMRPAVFVKGCDYADRIGRDVADYCERHGIEIRFTDTPKFSATALLDELRRG